MGNDAYHHVLTHTGGILVVIAEDENSLSQLGAENVCRTSAVSRCLVRVYFPNSQFEDAA